MVYQHADLLVVYSLILFLNHIIILLSPWALNMYFHKCINHQLSMYYIFNDKSIIDLIHHI